MKKIALIGLMLAATPLWAADAVEIQEAWVRGTVPTQTATGAFMKLTASQNLRLVAASSPVAGVVEIHEMTMDQQVMRMRRIDGLDLPAGKTIELKPGGHHVMLMDLKKPVAANDRVPITLNFQDAQGKRLSTTVEASVRPLGSSPMQGHQHGAHQH